MIRRRIQISDKARLRSERVGGVRVTKYPAHQQPGVSERDGIGGSARRVRPGAGTGDGGNDGVLCGFLARDG